MSLLNAMGHFFRGDEEGKGDYQAELLSRLLVMAGMIQRTGQNRKCAHCLRYSTMATAGPGNDQPDWVHK